MLTVDLSICVSGLDRRDSAYLHGIETDTVSQWEISGDLIGQWEAELLQLTLQELLCAAADEDHYTKTQVQRANSDTSVHLQDFRHYSNSVKRDVT